MKNVNYNKNALYLICSTLIIILCSNSPQSSVKSSIDGTLVNGIRIIKVASDSIPEVLNVYRGDAVELQFSRNIAVSCTIPEIKNVNSTYNDTLLLVKFTVADTGIFTVFSATMKKITTLKVTEFKSGENISITNLSGDEAFKVLKDTSILVLDVRTPAEFQNGHIPRAKLIPISELTDRINEIAQYKNLPVFIYCRSGNRSAVAIQILTRNGFNNILHLSGGIKTWSGDLSK